MACCCAGFETVQPKGQPDRKINVQIKNKKMKKEFQAGTDAQSSTTADNSTSASVVSKPNVSGSPLLELHSTGLKCDNPKCDWSDETISIDDWQHWINAKCPKCGENVLTLDDYNNAMVVMASAKLVNMFSIEDLEEISKGTDIEAFKEKLKQDGTEGVELLNEPDTKVIMSVNTNKEIKIKSFRSTEGLPDCH